MLKSFQLEFDLLWYNLFLILFSIRKKYSLLSIIKKKYLYLKFFIGLNIKPFIRYGWNQWLQVNNPEKVLLKENSPL